MESNFVVLFPLSLIWLPMSNNDTTNSVTHHLSALNSKEAHNFPGTKELHDLAQHHPEKLESLRQLWIERIIQSAPQQRRQRLRGLQFQIDAIRRGSKNPIHICVRLNTLMMDSLHRLGSAIQSSETDAIRASKYTTPLDTDAKILPLLKETDASPKNQKSEST